MQPDENPDANPDENADTVVVDTALIDELARTADRLSADGATADDLLRRYPDRIPEQLLDRLRGTIGRPSRESGVLVIKGLFAPLAARCAATPAHWAQATSISLDVALVLVATALGRVFGWSDQQDGHLVHNIVPSRGFEHLQVGASSSTALEYHTEDAFHPGRAHLLMLACVRNPGGIGTRIASVRQAGLSPAQLAALGRPVVRIAPDDSYAAWDHATARSRPRTPTVWWAGDGPCLRYDPAYSVREHDPAFEEAYRVLGESIQRRGRSVPLAAGDLAVIDNDVAVHGRVPFQPRYDGTDRWLKRIMVRLPDERPGAENDEDGYGFRWVDPYPSPEAAS